MATSAFYLGTNATIGRDPSRIQPQIGPPLDPTGFDNQDPTQTSVYQPPYRDDMSADPRYQSAVPNYGIGAEAPPAVPQQTPPAEAYQAGPVGSPPPRDRGFSQQTQDLADQAIQRQLAAQVPHILTYDEAAAQTESSLGPKPTPPTKASRLSRILAGAGDALQAGGMIYQGLHPKSIRAGRVGPGQFYSGLESKEDKEQQDYESALAKRGMIKTQMTPALIGQSRQEAEGVMRDQTSAALGVYNNLVASGKITGGATFAKQQTEAFGPAYDQFVDASGNFKEDARSHELDQMFLKALTSGGMSLEHARLTVEAAHGKAQEGSAQIQSRLGSAEASRQSARMNAIRANYYDNHGELLEGAMQRAHDLQGAAINMYNKKVGAMTNIGVSGQRPFNQQAWADACADVGVPPELIEPPSQEELGGAQPTPGAGARPTTRPAVPPGAGNPPGTRPAPQSPPPAQAPLTPEETARASHHLTALQSALAIAEKNPENLGLLRKVLVDTELFTPEDVNDADFQMLHDMAISVANRIAKRAEVSR